MNGPLRKWQERQRRDEIKRGFAWAAEQLLSKKATPDGLRRRCVDCMDQGPFDAGALDAVRAYEEIGAALATAAANDVLAERERQKSAEGWTPEHDDEHDDGSLAQAAACYLLNAQSIPFSCGNSTIWPWAREWWKPKDRRRDLVRAGALILAEIERLDRAAAVGAP